MHRNGRPPSEKRDTCLLTAPGGERIQYEVIRSVKRRRTIAVQVRDGVVTVRAPLATQSAEVEALVERRAQWILSLLAAEPHSAEALVQGQALPYAGYSVALEWERAPGARHTVALDGGVLRVGVGSGVPAANEPDFVAALLRRWYAERALERIDKSVARWGAVLQASPKAVLVRNQRSRWGSCSADGTLRFNWRLAMFDDDVVDYVVVHELTHLRHPNHAPAFWAEVSRATPHYDRARAALRKFSAPF